MTNWIFVPVGLRLEAKLIWETDGTVRRSFELSAMEQDSSAVVKLGRLDREGNLALARSLGRQSLAGPVRLAAFSASALAFERLAMQMAARVGSWYARAGLPNREITAVWSLQTISHPHKGEMVDWFELLVADHPFAPASRVYVQCFDQKLIPSAPWAFVQPTPSYRTRLSFKNAPDSDASAEPWPALRDELAALVAPRVEGLLPLGAFREQI